MKYTKEQRLDIGRRIYDGEITKFEAAEEYGMPWYPQILYRCYASIQNLRVSLCMRAWAAILRSIRIHAQIYRLHTEALKEFSEIFTPCRH